MAKKKNPFGDDYAVYLDGLKKFLDPVTAAKAAGIAYEDVYARRREDTLFAEAEIIAEEQGAYVNERNMRQLAAGGDARAIKFLSEERKSLEWRKLRGDKELTVEDGKRMDSIIKLAAELELRRVMFEEEVNIES